MTATPTSPLLVVSDLQAWYGESHVLHGVTFFVNAGEVVTLLGRNGAGKTTTLMSIMGMVAKRTGSVQFRDRELIGLASNVIARMGIAICRAASSRCWQSVASCVPAHACYCSTSRPRVWRR